MGNACEGRVALVTGASKGGTGTAIAVRMAAEGAKVGLAARTEDGLRATLDQIEAQGGQGAIFVVDLADPDGGRDTLVDRVTDALGPVDILINNAGATIHRPVPDWTLEDLRWAQEINCWAPWLLANAALPHMQEQGEGWIVNLSSSSAEHFTQGPPFPESPVIRNGSSGYGATKAYLNRWTWSLAAETYDQGVRVNALSPIGGVATPRLLENGWDPAILETLDAVAEATLALATAPAELTGRTCYTLELLVELGRPVWTLSGTELAAGSQPADLVALQKRIEDLGWNWPRRVAT